MKLKLKTLAGSHQFYYLTGKPKMFSVILVSLSLQISQRMPKLNTRNCSL